jgi:hypothetical protein
LIKLGDTVAILAVEELEIALVAVYSINKRSKGGVGSSTDSHTDFAAATDLEDSIVHTRRWNSAVKKTAREMAC